MERLQQAVKERDPLQIQDSRSEVSVSEINELAIWLRGAKVDTILFNIGSVHNIQGSERRVFLDVLWNEFNRMRGYNNSNLALAQYFEKVLDEKGKFEEFKQRIDEMGFTWEDECIALATTELDMILEIGKELVPTLTIDNIRNCIINDNINNLSVESFVTELKLFINKQPDNYRLIFLADEISQFIDNRPGLLLQLQQIVSDIHLPCDSKAWVACTAQQDLSEIVDSCNINKASEIRNTINQLSLQRDYLTQSVNIQATNAFNAILTAREKMTSNEITVRQAQKAYDIALVRYNQGVGTILELNSSELSLTQAKLNYSQATYDYLAARADYEKIIGEGFEIEDEQESNNTPNNQ